MGNDAVKWFPLDVHLDDSFDLIEAEFGLKGFAVIVKLYQKIYGSYGYYCEWTNDVALLFANKVGLGSSAVSEIVEASIRRGIFNREMYEKYSILTSKGIQERYFKAVKRRIASNVKNEYLLVKVTQNQKNVNISRENVCNSEENVCNFKQSREDKIRVDKSISDNSSMSYEDSSSADALSYYTTYINPAPGPAIIDEIDSFMMDKGMTEDCIIAILDYCRSEGKTSWSYIRTAIDGNFKDGVLTAEDYYKKREAFKNRKQADKPKSKFHNFEQRETDFQELEDEYFDDLIGERE